MLFRTLSVNLLKQYGINYWEIPQIFILNLNLLFVKIKKGTLKFHDVINDYITPEQTGKLKVI